MANKKAAQIQTAVEVSRLFYIDKVSQTAIAKKLGVSRPTVSRLLQYAQDEGIVEIKIHDPLDDVSGLDEVLANKYNLKKVIIADQIANSYENILDQLGRATANYLQKIVNDNDIIGLSWGHTMAAVAKYLQPSSCKNVQTVYLKGTVANSTHTNYSNVITQNFNRAFHNQTEILPVPVIFDNEKAHDIVLKDHFINKIAQKGRDANIALFTVGTTRPEAMLFQLGYFNHRTIEYLQEKAVGDIISQFIDKEGHIAAPQLSHRTMALSIDRLKKMEQSILVAGGMAKLPSIHAALVGGYPNVLITDLHDAEQLATM